MLSKSAIEGFLAELSASVDTSETRDNQRAMKAQDCITAMVHQDKQITKTKFKSLLDSEVI